MNLLENDHETTVGTNRLIFDCMENICHEMIQQPEIAHDKYQELEVRFHSTRQIECLSKNKNLIGILDRFLLDPYHTA